MLLEAIGDSRCRIKDPDKTGGAIPSPRILYIILAVSTLPDIDVEKDPLELRIHCKLNVLLQTTVSKVLPKFIKNIKEIYGSTQTMLLSLHWLSGFGYSWPRG